MAEVTGTEQGDILFGTNADDLIFALGGNDRVLGFDGNDVINGGSGDDNIDGDNGDDSLNGDGGNDILSGGIGVDSLNGGDGDDSLVLSSSDTIDGGDGIDVVRVDFSGLTLATGITYNHTSSAFSDIITLFGSTIANVEQIEFTSLTNFDDTVFFGPTFTRTTGIFAGLGNDNITGGSAFNLLSGEGGNDILVGGNGGNNFAGGNDDDIITGGTGSDSLTIQDGAGAITINVAAGTSSGTVRAGNDMFSAIERFNLFANSINFTGNSQNNTVQLSANTGTAAGGDGDDTYLITIAGATISIVETANGGAVDTVIVEGSFTLSDNVENLSAFFGNVNGNSLTGNGAANLIRASNGATTLSGLGGNDRLEGGIGADRLFGGDGDDDLRAGSGNDVLSGGLGNDILIGAADNDVLVGGGGNDSLSGGTGLNELIGGGGDDVYIIETRTDSTVESAGEGTDEVRTTFSIYGLQNEIENLTATDNGVHGALVGNTLDNVITGNTGNDDLFGRAGNDTLRGGSGTANSLFGQEGDDIYVVTAVGDSVIEFLNQGTDTVQTALASFVLRDHVENLTYTGTNAFTGIGASGANTLTGGAGADFLSGLGGADILVGKSGADFLLGGAGSDQYRYEGGETGFDRITDFVSGVDKIALRDAGFAQTASFALAQGGTPIATTTNSTFLYNINTGILSFDADGSGAGAAITLAQLNGGLTLAAGDFLFY